MNRTAMSLQQIGLFKGLSENLLEDISGKFRALKYEKGGQIFSELDSDGIYFLVGGKIKASKYREDGRCFVAFVYEAGEFFGEAILTHDTQQYVATALEHSSVLRLTKEAFRDLLDSNPEIARRYVALISERSFDMLERLACLSIPDGRERLENAMIFLQKRSKGSQAFPINLTHQELADYSGLVRETVTRIISWFYKEGKITSSGRSLSMIL